MADEGMGQSTDPTDLHLARAAREAGNEMEIVVVEEPEDHAEKEPKEEPTPFVDHRALLEEDDEIYVKAEFPGGHIFVRSITANERDMWEQEVGKTRGRDKNANVRAFRASFVAFCAVHEDGRRFYPDWMRAVRKLGKRRASVIDPIYAVAAKLNGVREQDEQEATAGF